VLRGLVMFPFLTDYEKIYLMQLFVDLERCVFGSRIDDKMRNPRFAPIIRFAMLCKEPISDGELDVIPMNEVLSPY